MVAAALIISIVALVASALCALAVMELIANRSDAAPDADDALIEEFEVSSQVAGTSAGAHGLPERIDGLDRHLVLVVSPMCARCALIARSLEGAIPADLTVVVTASAPARMRAWSLEVGLREDQVIFDDRMSIVASLEIASSPTVVGFGKGKVVFSAGIGGPAALDELVQQCAEGLFSEAVADALRRRTSGEPGGLTT